MSGKLSEGVDVCVDVVDGGWVGVGVGVGGGVTRESTRDGWVVTFSRARFEGFIIEYVVVECVDCCDVCCCCGGDVDIG